MELADAQDRDFASFSLDSNVIVEAGAGTGKTRILVDRFCFRLLAKDDGIDTFVALTFTEKAAAELKIRLSGVLSAIAAGRAEPGSHAAWLLEKLRAAFPSAGKSFEARARTALVALDRAQIGTIHSFASHLLRLYPLEAAVDPAFEVDEGSVFDELFDAELDKWLEEELRLDSPRAADWETLLHETELEHIRLLAWNLCLEKTEAAGQGSSRAAADFCLRAGGEAETLLARVGAAPKKPRKIELELAKAARALAAFGEGGGKAAPLREEIDTKISKVSGWDDASFAQAKKLVQLAAGVCSSGSGMTELGVKLLRPFAARFRQAYAAKGAVSFDGLLVRARNLLRDNREVRESLKRKYLAVFIDEFQDTDPLQGELLLYLCETPGGAADNWREIKLQAGKLFVVGDPKQSIYRFRGADMGAYGQFTALMEKQGARKCFLISNFRSSPGIINAVNAASGSIIAEREGLQPAYVPIKSAICEEGAAQDCGPSVSLLLYSPSGDGKKVKVGDSRRAQSAELARRILALVSGRADALRFRDIAVLVRSAAPLAHIIEAFRKADIPYVVEEDRYFYGTQEVSDLLCLLRALSEPGNETAVAGVLRSPLCPLDDAELYRLRRAGGFDYLKAPPKGFEKLEAFFTLLKTLHEAAGKLPLGAFVRRVVLRTNCAELLSTAYNGAQTLANVDKFTAIAAAFGERGAGGLEVFLAQAGRYMEEKRGEGESPLADESLDAVRIMTVHKAKGLEFPAVFLPDICAATGGGSQKPLLLQDWSLGLCGLRMGKHCDSAMPVLEFRGAEHQAEEEKRIFYVALTRAKRSLTLLGGPKPGKDSFAAHLKMAGLWPAEGEKGDAQVGTVLSVEYIDGKIMAGGRRGGKAKAAHQFIEQDCKNWALAWRERDRAFALAHEGGKVSATAIIEKEREALSPDRQEPQEARLLGLVCHKALERHAFGGAFSEEEIELAVLAIAFEEEFSDTGRIKEAAGQILRKFAASPAYAEISRGKILARELSFSFMEKTEAGAPLITRGVMDLVLEENGVIKILDYKTAGAQALSGGRYEAQKVLYLKAAAKIYPGKKYGFSFVSLTDGVNV